MANSWDGSGDLGKTIPPSHLAPDKEENVIREAEDVVKNFMAESYRHDSLDSEPVSSTPSVPELANFTTSPLSSEARVGQRLAIIGDDINEKYAHEFNSMISKLNLSPDTAYEAFASVARKLFSDGFINWGRIVTLLCFGYRMAIQVIGSTKKAFGNFVSKIVKFVVKFIISEKIAKWIADNGGWISALAKDAIPSIGYPTLAVIMGLGLLSAVVVIVRARRGG